MRDDREQFSKDFSTPRNSKQVVEESVFDSVNLDAQHGGYSGNVRDYILT